MLPTLFLAIRTGLLLSWEFLLPSHHHIREVISSKYYLSLNDLKVVTNVFCFTFKIMVGHAFLFVF